MLFHATPKITLSKVIVKNKNGNTIKEINMKETNTEEIKNVNKN